MSIFIATLVAARDPDAFGLIVHGSALFVAAGGATYLTWYLLWHPYPNPNPNPNPNTNQAQADDGRERVCVRHSM